MRERDACNKILLIVTGSLRFVSFLLRMSAATPSSSSSTFDNFSPLSVGSVSEQANLSKSKHLFEGGIERQEDESLICWAESTAGE